MDAPYTDAHMGKKSTFTHGKILPCGRVVALRRRGAAPPGDEVLRGHGGEQQRELQHRGGRELRHDCASVT